MKKNSKNMFHTILLFLLTRYNFMKLEETEVFRINVINCVFFSKNQSPSFYLIHFLYFDNI